MPQKYCVVFEPLLPVLVLTEQNVFLLGIKTLEIILGNNLSEKQEPFELIDCNKPTNKQLLSFKSLQYLLVFPFSLYTIICLQVNLDNI